MKVATKVSAKISLKYRPDFFGRENTSVHCGLTNKKNVSKCLKIIEIGARLCQ